MSVSALTTAMAVAAAAVPSEAPAPVGESASGPVSVNYELAQVGAAAPSEIGLLPLLAQSATQSSDLGQSTEPGKPADPAQSAGPAPPQPQTPAPVGQPSDIVVTGRKPVPEDPLAELNSTSFEVAQTVDKSIVAPIAFTYEEVMPRPVRQGLRNFLHNLGEPIVFLNFLLQLKIEDAAETLGRFAINTTLGAGGLVDVAKRKPFNLPYRHNGFANTLGYYGVKPGPYFYLPLVGPTTLRDFIGDRLDLFILPTIVGSKFRDLKIVTPVWVLKELDRRIEIEEEVNATQAKPDPYVAARVRYLQKRQAEIDALHGRRSAIQPSVPLKPSDDPAPPAARPAPPQPSASSLTPPGQ